MQVKGAKALAARVRSSSYYEPPIPDEVLSFDPEEEMMETVVAMQQDGGLDFLDPLAEDRPQPPEFDLLFSHHMMVEFGSDNGVFLLERFKAGKVSPKMKRTIEAIRDYTKGVFRRQYLAKNRTVIDTIAELYRRAYFEGGLTKVDAMIIKLNEKLVQAGSRFGIGPGTACMEGDNGTTEWIAVIFTDLEKEEFVSLEWCHLAMPEFVF